MLSVKIGFFGLLGLLFIGLKLAGQIAWSWALVLLPLYGIPVLILIILFAALLLAIVEDARRNGGGKH